MIRFTERKAFLRLMAIIGVSFALMFSPRQASSRSLVMQQSCWTPWYSLSGGYDHVSVSVCRIDRETWTWKFRNDDSRTITDLEFEYTDASGTHSDVLPGSLKPYGVFGGWAAFTANSRPLIVIKKVTRE